MPEGSSPPLLDRLTEIDSNWLTKVLRQAGHVDATVRTFAMRPIGAGNVSDTVSVSLEVDDAPEAPSSVVCKFSCSDPGAHAHGVGSGSYHREVGSYSLLSDIDDGCRIPKLLWVAGGHDNINLVIEDLGGTTRPGDQVAGCDPDDALSVVTELAKLHRSFYPLARAEAPTWAMTMANTADYWVAAIERALPIIREHAFDRLDAQQRLATERACAVAGHWYHLPVTRATLTHGDPRVDNILFLGKPGFPGRAVLIDWQMTGWRNPMHDVGYFLSGSVSVGDRRKHEGDLLETYAAFYRADQHYDRDAIRADYRVQLLSGLMTTIAAYGVLALTPATDLLLITLLQRNLAASLDWGSFDAIP